MNTDSLGHTATKDGVAVLGASGFVGSAVVDALSKLNVSVLTIRSPRLSPCFDPSAESLLTDYSDEVELLREQMRGIRAVINCAGLAEPNSNDEPSLNAANGVLPLLIAEAATLAGCDRFIHVSTTTVQGRQSQLDQTATYDPFSPYARSKVAGERNAARAPITTIYRPPGVHGHTRPTTATLRSLAKSALSTVAFPGSDPTPQALIENVAAAVAHLATCSPAPPAIVLHPWEGLTTRTLLLHLGGKPPTLLPRILARLPLRAGRVLASALPRLDPHLRRLEMLWFGQAQATSWLTQQGWTPPVGLRGWETLSDTTPTRQSFLTQQEKPHE